MHNYSLDLEFNKRIAIKDILGEIGENLHVDCTLQCIIASMLHSLDMLMIGCLCSQKIHTKVFRDELLGFYIKLTFKEKQRKQMCKMFILLSPLFCVLNYSKLKI